MPPKWTGINRNTSKIDAMEVAEEKDQIDAVDAN
jgi:hypothetical protein